MSIRLCAQCVNPSTRPKIIYNALGLCPVCQYENSKKEQTIDWNARRRELKSICVWGKKETKSTYDCIVTVSGGKDSTRQACFARDELA